MRPFLLYLLFLCLLAGCGYEHESPYIRNEAARVSQALESYGKQVLQDGKPLKVRLSELFPDDHVFEVCMDHTYVRDLASEGVREDFPDAPTYLAKWRKYRDWWDTYGFFEYGSSLYFLTINGVIPVRDDSDLLRVVDPRESLDQFYPAVCLQNQASNPLSLTFEVDPQATFNQVKLTFTSQSEE